MRSIMWAALLGLVIGCTHGGVQVVAHGATTSLDELARAHPLATGQNIRVDEIERTPAASVHLVQVQGGETPHRHVAHDLTVAMLRGEGALTLSGATRAMRAGDVAVIPRGSVHWFVRSGRVPAVAIAVFAPPLDAPDSVPDPGIDSPSGAR